MEHTDLPEAAVQNRSIARKGIIFLAVAGGLVAVGLIAAVLMGSNEKTASHSATRQPLAADLAPAARPAAKATAAAPVKGAKVVRVAAKVTGIDMSEVRLVGYSKKDGKLTVRYSGVKLQWSKGGNNNAVATAEGGAK